MMPTAGLGMMQSHGVDKHTDVARQLIFYATYPKATVHDYHAIQQLNDGINNDVYFNWKVPDDFVSLTSVHVVVMAPNSSGDMVWRVYIDYAANGEAFDTHSEDDVADRVTSLTQNKVTELDDVSNRLTNLAEGDYVALRMRRFGGSASDTVNDIVDVLYLVVKYTAEQ